GIADARHFEARFVKFRPQLKVVPGERHVLPEDKLAVIADPMTAWKGRRGFGEKVRAGTGGEADVPHFIRTKAGASADGGVLEPPLSDPPGFGPGGQRGILHFRRVIESAATAGDCETARVVRTPN